MKNQYEHFVSMVKERPEYPGANTHILVKSLDELRTALDNPNKYIAWDTETSSLSPEEGELVGFSFSFDGKTGYYVPLNHVGNQNLPFKEALDMFYERLLKAERTFIYNMRFDFRWMEYQGYDMSKVKYYDVAVGVWLSDTNVKFPSLKMAERRWLGWNPDTYEETVGDAASFKYISPEDAFAYASVDAEGTYAVALATIKYYKEAKVAGKIENDSLYPLMKYEEEELLVDVDYLHDCILAETERLHELQQRIYQIFGYQFKLNSPRQLGEALQSIGIHTGQYTAKGAMKVDIKTLQHILVKEPDNEVLKLIIEQSQISKSLSAYFETMYSEAQRRGGKARFSYLTNNVPCLTKNNYVLIRDKGIVSVADVEKGDYIWSGRLWCRVTWVHKYPASSILKVDFENGQYIEGTDDHLLAVKTEDGQIWKRLADLDEGDDVILNSKPCAWSGTNVNSNPVSYWTLAGMVFGSELLNESSKNVIYGFRVPMDEAMKFLGYGDNVLKVVKGVSINYLDDIHCIEITVKKSSKFYRSVLKRRPERGLPPELYDCGPEVWSIFLAGYVTANLYHDEFFYHGRYHWHDGGHEPSPKPIMLLRTYSYRERLQLQNLFSALSIDARWMLGVWLNKKYAGQFYLAIMDESSLGAVLREIYPFMIFTTRLYKIRGFVDTDELRTTRIVTSVRGDGDWVWDIEVANSHVYVANGIVTHNTSRLACGAERKNPYYSHINAQSSPKPHPRDWFVRDFKDGEEIGPDEFRVLDWVFSTTRESNRIIEGFDQYNDFRSAFVAGDDEYWVSIDYSAQELRIIANLSNEPGWVDTFLGGGDLHKQMAIQMWGEENYDKEKRRRAKTLNFGMCPSVSSYVMTDHGYIRAGDLNPTKYKLINRFGRPVDYRCRIKEDQPTFEVTFRNGAVGRYRAGHRFWCFDGEKFDWVPVEKAKGLKVATYLPESGVFSKAKGSWPISSMAHGSGTIDVCGGLWPYILGCYVSSARAQGSRHLTLDVSPAMATWIGTALDKYSIPFSIKEVSRGTLLVTLKNATLSSEIWRLFGKGQRTVPDEVFKHFGPEQAYWFFVGLFRISPKGRVYQRKFITSDREVISRLALLANVAGFGSVFVKKPDGFHFTIEDTVFRRVKRAPVFKPFRGNHLDDVTVTDVVDVVEVESDSVVEIEIVGDEPEYVSDTVVSHNCYGMSGYSLAQRFDVSVEEGNDIVNRFWKAAPHIKRFQDIMVRKARKEGTTYNYLGLPRRVRYYFNSSDPKQRSFGVRTVNNTNIQSVGAGLLKLAMIKLFPRLYGDLREKIRFQVTVHDEINFVVKKEGFRESLDFLVSKMVCTLPGWKVPFEVGIEIGTKWGATFPFHINEDGLLLPSWEIVNGDTE